MNQGIRRLPVGWITVSLKQLGSISQGGTPDTSVARYWNGPYPFITGADITDLYVEEGRSSLTEAGLNSPKTQKCEPGDVLIVTRTRVGRIGIAAKVLAVSQDVSILKLKRGYSTKCVVLLLLSLAPKLQEATQGATIKGLTRHYLENIELCLPEDLNDQEKLAREIESRLHRIAQMRRAAQRQLEASESLTQSHLANIFPIQDLTEIPASWSVERLRDLSRSIDYGLSLSASKQPRGPKFVRITDIQDGEVNWDSVPYCDCRAADALSAKLQDGDILFARTGATTGKSFLIRNPPPAVFASYLIRVQCHLDRVSPDYLYAFFQSKLYWQAINKGARGGAQAGFNATMLGDLCIPLPASKDEQTRIAASFQQFDQTARAIRVGCERQLDAISALPAATLRQFFNFGDRADG